MTIFKEDNWMKNITHGVLVIILGGLLCNGSLLAQTLKVATLAPEGSDWMVALRTASQEIESLTEGRVKLKLYGGGVQGSDQNVIRKMRVGQLHGMTTTGGGLAMLHEDAGLYSLPMMFRESGEADYVRFRMDSDLRQGLEDAGWVNFGFTFSGFAYLMSRQPIASLTDLKKLKVWVPKDNRIGYDAIRTLGGAPVQMPMTDVLTGLETGLLDTVVTSAVGAVVFQWHGQVRYITNLPLVYLYGALVIDKRPFSRLRPGDQLVVREVMEYVHQYLDEQGALDDADYMSALLDSGIDMVNVELAQIESWRGRVLSSNRHLAEQGAFSKSMLDRLEKHLGDYRAQLLSAPVAKGALE
jgi:TRAP-type C4-dicarboxylate transport system substrate-binding protein